MTFTDDLLVYITSATPVQPLPAGGRQASTWPAVRIAVEGMAHRAHPLAEEAVAYQVGCVVADQVAAALDSTDTANGWSRRSVAGVVGAGAALGRLLQFDEVQLRHLLGLCATQAAGLEAVDDTETGALQVAKAGADAVEAALLVSHGFTSSADGLSGRRGLFALIAAGATPVFVADGPVDRSDGGHRDA
jgi:2-methylcitrate dehydratase PrpD